MKNKRIFYYLRTFVIGIAVAVLVFSALKILFDKPAITINSISSEVNKQLPQSIDSQTVLNNTTVLNENTLQYNYTIINYSKVDINIEELRNSLRPTIIKGLNENTNIKWFRDHNIKLSYNYLDKNNEFVLNITLSSDQY